MKKILIAAAALATVAAPIAASAHPGDDGGRGRFEQRGYHRGGDNGGAAVAAGLFGLFLGAAIASNHSDYDYPSDGAYGAYGDYGYDGYQPYRQRCDWETRAYPGPWGRVTYQQVQVCR